MVPPMRLVELDSFSAQQEAAIEGDEPAPWGGGAAETLSWSSKQRYVAALDGDGQPVGVIGALVVEVEVGDAARFPVVGLGGLIVTAALRGQGVGGRLIERMLEIAAAIGPQRAMLFCAPELVRRYERYGFRPIEDAVFAEQPSGRVEMPVEAMWRGLREDAGWPAGRVDVLGLPF
jgi:GNAT superfamily N-acetyltransferase